jgi:hypothetical protein
MRGCQLFGPYVRNHTLCLQDIYEHILVPKAQDFLSPYVDTTLEGDICFSTPDLLHE